MSLPLLMSFLCQLDTSLCPSEYRNAAPIETVAPQAYNGNTASPVTSGSVELELSEEQLSKSERLTMSCTSNHTVYVVKFFYKSDKEGSQPTMIAKGVFYNGYQWVANWDKNYIDRDLIQVGEPENLKDIRRDVTPLQYEGAPFTMEVTTPPAQMNNPSVTLAGSYYCEASNLKGLKGTSEAQHVTYDAEARAGTTAGAVTKTSLVTVISAVLCGNVALGNV